MRAVERCRTVDAHAGIQARICMQGSDGDGWGRLRLLWLAQTVDDAGKIESAMACDTVLRINGSGQTTQRR